MRKCYVLRFTAMLAVLGNFLFAADFVAPAEGPVAFRRDQIPLDSDTIATLSKQLVALAEGVDASTAANRRGVAQMLALATALDPSNTPAREMITEFQLGTHESKADVAQIDRIRLKTWQYIAWLESPEAGPQGGALAACLVDVMAISDPKNPRVEELRKSGERGAWAGWIPAVSAYETKSVAKIEEQLPPETPAADIGKKTPQLDKAKLVMPLLQATGKDEMLRWVLTPCLVQMSAKTVPGDEQGAPKPFSLTIGLSSEGVALNKVANSIKLLLKKEHHSLPAGRNIIIASEDMQKSFLSGKRPMNSAAFAVLASAAITGREPDATVIGMVDEKGALTLPTDFWDQLVCLEKGTGGRLVLPAAAAEILPSILALEQPQFFLDHEVLLASNFHEMLELSAKIPSEAISNTSAKFQEIHSKIGNQTVGQYVANSFIRRRLADISQEAPYHFSARMLSIQGAGNRPTQITRPVLIAELRRAIAPMTWIIKPASPLSSPLEAPKLELLNKTYEVCRADVNRLERYVEKADLELFTATWNMVALMRPLERAARVRNTAYTTTDVFENARVALLRAYLDVAQKLSDQTPEAAAEPDPE